MIIASAIKPKTTKPCITAVLDFLSSDLISLHYFFLQWRWPMEWKLMLQWHKYKTQRNESKNEGRISFF